MKQSAIDALAMTGIELEELQDVGAALLKEAPKDSRVCICGHSMNKHTAINGYVLCKPSRMACPCKAVRPVLTSTNVRPFMRKSLGSGSAHALMQGFRKAIELDADISCFLTQFSPKSFDITHANLVSNASHFHYRFAKRSKTHEQSNARILCT
jgi:hypothetical protein